MPVDKDQGPSHTPFDRQGRCPSHCQIVLRKRGKFGIGWKTIRLRCPLCVLAADESAAKTRAKTLKKRNSAPCYADSDVNNFSDAASSTFTLSTIASSYSNSPHSMSCSKARAASPSRGTPGGSPTSHAGGRKMARRGTLEDHLHRTRATSDYNIESTTASTSSMSSFNSTAAANEGQRKMVCSKRFQDMSNTSCTYTGQIHSHSKLPHGIGILLYKNGKSDGGEWSNGVLIRPEAGSRTGLRVQYQASRGRSQSTKSRQDSPKPRRSSYNSGYPSQNKPRSPNSGQYKSRRRTWNNEPDFDVKVSGISSPPVSSPTGVADIGHVHHNHTDGKRQRPKKLVLPSVTPSPPFEHDGRSIGSACSVRSNHSTRSVQSLRSQNSVRSNHSTISVPSLWPPGQQHRRNKYPKDARLGASAKSVGSNHSTRSVQSVRSAQYRNQRGGTLHENQGRSSSASLGNIPNCRNAGHQFEQGRYASNNKNGMRMVVGRRARIR